MEANYVHKDSTTLVQDELVKNDLNQIELQYNALRQQKFNELLKENQELKEQLDKYENPEDMTLMMMWCTEKVKDENQELKKQVEDYKKLGFKHLVDKNNNLETQQKEFIKWLENGIEKVKNTEFLDERIQRAGLIAYNRCLRKYKKITQTE